MRIRTVFAAALAVCPALAGLALAQNRPTQVKPIDTANLDTTCAPCKDFYQFANGNWLKRMTIPPDRSSLGAFGMLGDKNQEIVQHIVTDAAKQVSVAETPVGSITWKIGSFFTACMDTVAIDKASFTP